MSSHAESPLFSIIIAAYNSERTIVRTLQSVLRQTYAHFEVLIVNDGSTDTTGAIADAYAEQDARFKVLHQNNQGVSHARNHAIQQAQGQYIAFLDADDFWFPTFLEVSLDAFIQQGSPVGLVYHWYYMVDERCRLVNLSPKLTLSGNIYNDMLTQESVLFNTHTVMHRDVVTQLGGFPTDCYHEDRVFYLRLTKHFPVFPTHQRLAVYQQSLSGRCRRILENYDKAMDAEMSIVRSLANELSTEETEALMAIQKRNLFYRFLMYDFVPSARRLSAEIPMPVILGTKKGLLAWVSMLTGLNVLNGVRVMIQKAVRTLCHPWWLRQSQPVRFCIESLERQGYAL